MDKKKIALCEECQDSLTIGLLIPELAGQRFAKDPVGRYFAQERGDREDLCVSCARYSAPRPPGWISASIPPRLGATQRRVVAYLLIRGGVASTSAIQSAVAFFPAGHGAVQRACHRLRDRGIVFRPDLGDAYPPARHHQIGNYREKFPRRKALWVLN